MSEDDLAQQLCINAYIREGLAQAQRKEYVSNQEMGIYFTRFAIPEIRSLWTKECEKRMAANDRGEIPLFDSDNVMQKNRQ